MENCNQIFNNEQFSYTAIPAKDFGLLMMIHLVLKMEKGVNFTTPTAKGPDTEGITVDGNGFVYLASECDNSDKGVNYNVILKADPNAQGTSQNAMQQWDLTSSLPSVSANMGIETVEWVSNSNVAGKLFDQNTNKVFDPSNYPNEVADIDSKLGGVIALDYDIYKNKLWVAADDGYGNL